MEDIAPLNQPTAVAQHPSGALLVLDRGTRSLRVYRPSLAVLESEFDNGLKDPRSIAFCDDATREKILKKLEPAA